MKIFYAASSCSHLENFHLPYLRALRAAGHTVLTVAPGDRADLPFPIVKKMFSGQNRAARRLFADAVRREKPDVILVNTTLAAFHIRLALPRKERPRVVNFVHGYLFGEHRRSPKEQIFLLCERLLCRKTDAVLTMNAEDTRLAVRYRLAPSVTEVPGMGVPVRLPAHTREEVRAGLSASESTLVLLFAGELSDRKNQKSLIAALPALLSHGIPAELWLAGDGDRKEELKTLTETLGVAPRVKFLGKRTDVPDLLSAADLYVSMSRCEGLPFNIVEAMLAGLPVLASDIKGHRDLLSAAPAFLCASDTDFREKLCRLAALLSAEKNAVGALPDGAAPKHFAPSAPAASEKTSSGASGSRIFPADFCPAPGEPQENAEDPTDLSLSSARKKNLAAATRYTFPAVFPRTLDALLTSLSAEVNNT